MRRRPPHSRDRACRREAVLQGFFDYADEQVTRARDSGRKGWLPAFRDAVFKVAYGYGLRRNETRMLHSCTI